MSREKRKEMLTEEMNIVETPVEEESPVEVETNGGPETRTGTIVDREYVNVRKKPSMEADILEVMRKGDKVIILDEGKTFTKVKTSVNPVGYIHNDFLKED